MRIKSIIRKYREEGGLTEGIRIVSEPGTSEKELMKAVALFPEAVSSAYAECAPHRICNYAYELSNAMNAFYHENRILGIDDKEKQKSLIALIDLTGRILETCAGLLGFSVPERM